MPFIQIQAAPRRAPRNRDSLELRLEDLLGFRRPDTEASPRPSPVVRPRADWSEEETGYRLQVELPGVSRDALKIELRDGQLHLEVPPAEAAAEASPTQPRRPHYRRTFGLPEAVDRAGIEARLADGLLTVELPKPPAAQPRRIAVT